LGMVSAVLLGALVAIAQDVTFKTFIWTLFHFNGYYNTYFQLGIVANIGIFFLMIRNPKTIYFAKGWLFATILMAVWTVSIELHWSL